MNKKFVINEVTEEQEGYFDRQQLISWWKPEVLLSAKVMVVGAGAIGNETLKNLALLGVGNIFIVDFDHISASNLSRTVLFRKSDIKQKKAEVAAKRIRELCLYEKTKVDWFHGDAVWELGTGVFRSMDIVLGCLDNIETRFAINRQCRLAGVPWIDAGITELRGRVNVYGSKGVCYECSMTREQHKARRVRYSCDVFKKRMFAEGKVPTVQISSALVSSIQVQEAIKLLHGQNGMLGHMVFYEGISNEFDRLRLMENTECEAHLHYPEVTQLKITNEIRLDEFLVHVSKEHFRGEPVCLKYRGDSTFVKSVECIGCKTPIHFCKPAFQLFYDELFCKRCRESSLDFESQDGTEEIQRECLDEFSLQETEDSILKMTLQDLGIPKWDIVAVQNKEENYRYFELQGDTTSLMPNIFSS